MRPALAPSLLLIPFLWFARRLTSGHFVPPTPLDWSLAALLLMVLVSLYATFDLALSLPKVAGVLYGAAVYYALADVVDSSEKRLWAAVALFIAAGVGVATIGLFVTRWPAKTPILAPLTARLPASLSVVNPNAVAGVLLWTTPLAVAVTAAVIIGRIWSPWGWTAGCLAPITTLGAFFMVGVLLLTQSRSGWLGLTAGIGLMALATQGRYRRAAMVAVLLVAAVAASAALLSREAPFPALLHATGAGSALGGAGLAVRQELWTRAVFGLQDFAFTGIGMGTFREVVHVLYPLFLIGPETDIAHAHNHLLQAALDLGLPGLVAYLSVWFGVAVLLWQSWRRTSSARLRALAVGLGGSLSASFIYGLTDTVTLGARQGFLLWYLLGLVVALHQVTVQR